MDDEGLGTRYEGLGTRDKVLGTRDEVPDTTALVPCRNSLADRVSTFNVIWSPVPCPSSLVPGSSYLVPSTFPTDSPTLPLPMIVICVIILIVMKGAQGCSRLCRLSLSTHYS